MRRLRAGAKLAGIVAGLAAVPTVLYATAGNPLPGWPVDWGLVAESLATGAVATSTWLQVVAVAGWLVWGYLIVALTLDVLATVRNRPSPVRAAPVRWLASTIVALATQLSTVSMASVPAPATTEVHVAAASYDPTDTGDLLAVGPDVPEGTRLVTVAEGDSWAGFAQTAVGDADAGPQIRTLNAGRDAGGRVLDGSEAFVEAGWHLLVPSAEQPTPVALEADEDLDRVKQQTADEPDEPVGGESWTVEDGEHFWSIAETILEDARGEPPSESEVASYWRELIAANEDRLLPPYDPDLIYPGQSLIIPAVEVSAAAPAEPDAREGPPDDAAPEASAERPEPRQPDRAGPRPGVPSANGSGPTAAADDSDAFTAEADDTTTSTATDENNESDASAGHGSDTDEVELERTGWGTPVGLAAGSAATMLLAGGVLTLLRRRRRIALQQRPVRVRLPPLTDEQIAQTARLDAAAAPGEVLDELADLFCSIPDDVEPVLVAANDDGSVTLTFGRDEQLPTPPSAPWANDDPDADGRPRWTATLGARGPRRSIGLPLLVTLGRHATATVLGNVAAMRLLTVAGDDAAAVGRQLRAFALEVATSRTAGPVQVSVAGEAASTPLVDQLRRSDDPDVEVAAAAEEVAQGIIAEDRLPRLIVCHTPASVPRLPDHVDLVGIITDHEPTADAARWRLQLNGHRRVLHQPGVPELVLDSPDFDPDLVTDELAGLDGCALVACEGHADGEVAAPDVPAVEGRGWCEVAVLGPVAVTLGDEPLDLSPMLLQILAYLATHPDTTTGQLEDAIWAGQAAGSGQRVRAALTRLRSAVGTTPDGEPLVPRRGPGDHTLELSREVSTDLDRAFGHLQAARRLDGDERLTSLLAALTLVRGAPFQDLAVSWAADLEHRAVARLQDAALEAAPSLLAAGRLDEAEQAVQQGLKLCDPCEPLYVVWAQIEHARGRPDRITHLWTRLRRRYADDADATLNLPAAPMADTERAFAALAGSHPGAG
ncbi:MAG: hypothetical protein KG028_05740 [Actinobacteria bacterium]|jgi:hypothetical protein|nr:hypothetical protein [Actinomycetota bacterium]